MSEFVFICTKEVPKTFHISVPAETEAEAMKIFEETLDSELLTNDQFKCYRAYNPPPKELDDRTMQIERVLTGEEYHKLVEEGAI